MATIGFLERVQTADDSAKRLWIAAGTALIMTAIVALWLLFFPPVPSPRANAEASNFSFGGSLRGMTASVADSLRGLAGALGRAVTAPKQYIISPTP